MRLNEIIHDVRNTPHYLKLKDLVAIEENYHKLRGKIFFELSLLVVEIRERFGDECLLDVWNTVIDSDFSGSTFFSDTRLLSEAKTTATMLTRRKDVHNIIGDRFVKDSLVRLAQQDPPVQDEVLKLELEVPEWERPSNLPVWKLRQLFDEIKAKRANENDNADQPPPEDMETSINKPKLPQELELALRTSLREIKSFVETIGKYDVSDLQGDIIRDYAEFISAIDNATMQCKDICVNHIEGWVKNQPLNADQASDLEIRHTMQEPPVRLYAALLPQKNMLTAIRRLGLFDDRVCGLMSFAIFKTCMDRADVRAMETFPMFADSGAFSARDTKADLFVRWNVDTLADFYNGFDFAYLVEPDIIPNRYGGTPYEDNLNFSSSLAILRARRLYRLLNENKRLRMVRPLHGRNVDERMMYYDRLESQLGFNEYCALGGLDKKDFEDQDFWRTLLKLDRAGVRKVHLFSRTAEEAIRFAFQAIQELHFTQITLDGTTWMQLSGKGREVLLVRPDGSFKKISFHTRKAIPSHNVPAKQGAWRL